MLSPPDLSVCMIRVDFVHSCQTFQTLLYYVFSMPSSNEDSSSDSDFQTPGDGTVSDSDPGSVNAGHSQSDADAGTVTGILRTRLIRT